MATRLSKKKRETFQPLVRNFIIRSFFILPSCQNRHRTHHSVIFYFTVLSEPSQDSSFMMKKNISALNHIICTSNKNINIFLYKFFCIRTDSFHSACQISFCINHSGNCSHNNSNCYSKNQSSLLDFSS